MQDLSQLIAEAKSAFAQATAPAALEDAKAKFLGKTGSLTAMMKGLAKLSHEEKREMGQALGTAKREIEQALEARREELANEKLAARLAAEALDVTLPGRKTEKGGVHPVIATQMRIEQIFRSIGFEVADGPEIETDWYSFTALNNPPNHPARSMHSICFTLFYCYCACFAIAYC